MCAGSPLLCSRGVLFLIDHNSSWSFPVSQSQGFAGSFIHPGWIQDQAGRGYSVFTLSLLAHSGAYRQDDWD